MCVFDVVSLIVLGANLVTHNIQGIMEDKEFFLKGASKLICVSMHCFSIKHTNELALVVVHNKLAVIQYKHSKCKL